MKMHTSVFGILLLIASCIFTLVTESKAEIRKPTADEIKNFYSRFYNIIPKMKSCDDPKCNVTELNRMINELDANTKIENSKLEEINNTLVEVDKETMRSLKIFTEAEVAVWIDVINKIKDILKKENITFGIQYVVSQYSTVLNETIIRKIEKCPEKSGRTVTDHSILTEIIQNANKSQVVSNLEEANTKLKDLLTYINTPEMINCKPTDPLSEKGKKLLELAKPEADKVIVSSPWKKTITIGIAVIGTIASLALYGASIMTKSN
ncbi:uncharacterized protein LOC122503960 [Leptopilina heterotoma]|uniref:uncharacterized protein LOC122503960 n=1 Tax=Leptopilina heterotoma TaxID=63436 RepID=UPI001CA9A1CC|nr:uncharacterized protein LOC122503960 [Leptopilina heterotoma]